MIYDVIKFSRPTPNDMTSINQFCRVPMNADLLTVMTFTLCTDEIDEDNEKFSLKGLGDLAKEYVGKSGTLNDDVHARIYRCWIETDKYDEMTVHRLQAKAYIVRSAEAIECMKDLQQNPQVDVSISCSARVARCSICRLPREQCIHTAGEYYDNKLCYIELEDIVDVYEWAVLVKPSVPDYVSIHPSRQSINTRGYHCDYKTKHILDSSQECLDALAYHLLGPHTRRSNVISWHNWNEDTTNTLLKIYGRPGLIQRIKLWKLRRNLNK